jgi:predicted transcriptional regulator
MMFELSHPERIRILNTLKEKPMRMSHLSKKLKLTTAEVSRHLERLRKVELIEKKSGEYLLTSVGSIALYGLSNVSFLIQNHEFILNHDLTAIPPKFMCFEPITKAELMEGTMDIMGLIRDISEESQDYVQIMSASPLKTVVDLNIKKAEEGVEFQLIYPEGIEIPDGYLRTRKNQIEVRTIGKVPIAMKINEKRGGLVLPDFAGRLDFGFALIGDNPMFHQWLKILFESFWIEAKPL